MCAYSHPHQDPHPYPHLHPHHREERSKAKERSIGAMPSPTKVTFPSADSDCTPTSLPISPQPLATHLPFRRISLPAVPNLNSNRLSVVSLASFDSLSEQGTPHSPIASPTRKSNRRRTSIESHRKGARRRGYRAPDEERDAKRRKVIDEFFETERTYVQGLDLIYELFLTPIIAALDTPQPLLDRADLTSIFSNFIDIWNLHRAFFSSLNEHLHPTATPEAFTQSPPCTPPHLSPVLQSHFPYLSLYTPFVTSFSASLAALTTLLNTNSAFSAFVARQQADPRCGKLKLRDWLLTIVQRCPRYLLLLKDLINSTDSEDPEYSSLTSVHALVSKITTSLNASLHTHAQTLALLALQRNTPNLPFQLIAPGRTFLKRGSLLQLERGSFPKERDFVLFSDCLLWIANLDKGDSEPTEHWDWKGVKTRPNPRPVMARSRSRSEAELSMLRSRVLTGGAGTGFSPLAQPVSPTLLSPSALSSRSVVSPTRVKKRQASSGNGEERWWFKGKAELVDLEVVVTASTEVGEESRFEVWSPGGSFAVYAASESERDEWSTAIRNAKAALLASLNVTHPDSTLSSSASTNHLRRTLQALPHLPDDVRNQLRRGRVEHFVPAVWIPDGKTESCMRCGRPFSWRRRRHHCRLCGRCVCANCSGSTFYIFDSDAKEPGIPARSCDACYETVFPVLTPSVSSSIPPSVPTLTLSKFPSWHSTPALSLARPPSLLMAIDKSSPKRALTRIDDITDDCIVPPTEDGGGQGDSMHPVIRIRPASRPRSSLHILEDFQEESSQVTPSPSTSQFSAQTDESTDVTPSSLHSSFPLANDSGAPSLVSLPPSATSPPTPSGSRMEDTARRRKRFSLPVVGLQTTPVTARASAKSEGLVKRFSLVLGGGRTVRGSKVTRVGRQSLEEAMECTIKESRGTGNGATAAM
ncbi:hypothetical protein B0F90DRAFT_1675982 [Multifurca ochricompacta]|uniref:Uncharacterized protein n=1 Tax=Multifurca ochricompacta TaxID=376703 RepID=A0AAD4QTP4_9AGAM|nr:hypothetical protein B0F90DRAFT_1675982 [Multifurca ochricompacta]